MFVYQKIIDAYLRHDFWNVSRKARDEYDEIIET